MRTAIASIAIGSVSADPLGQLTDKPIPLVPIDEMIDWANSENTISEFIPDPIRRRQLEVETHVLSPSLLRIVAKSPSADDALNLVTDLSDTMLARHQERFERWYADASAVAQRLRDEVNAGKEHIASLEPSGSPSDSLSRVAEQRELAALERQAMVASLAINPIYSRSSSIVAPPALKPLPRGGALLGKIAKTSITAAVLGALLAALAIFVGAQLREQQD